MYYQPALPGAQSLSAHLVTARRKKSAIECQSVRLALVLSLLVLLMNYSTFSPVLSGFPFPLFSPTATASPIEFEYVFLRPPTVRPWLIWCCFICWCLCLLLLLLHRRRSRLLVFLLVLLYFLVFSLVFSLSRFALLCSSLLSVCQLAPCSVASFSRLICKCDYIRRHCLQLFIKP